MNATFDAQGVVTNYDCTALGVIMSLPTRGLSWARMQCDRLDTAGAWGGLVIVLKGRLSPDFGAYYEIDATKRINAASGVSLLIDITGYAQISMEITTVSSTSGARADMLLYAVGQTL